jgi:hypothetical protein
MTQLRRCMTRGNAVGAADAVWVLRARGWTWAEIGEVLGISRQAAHRRWADRAGKEPRPLRRRQPKSWWDGWSSARSLRESEATEPSRSLGPVRPVQAHAEVLGQAPSESASEKNARTPRTAARPQRRAEPGRGPGTTQRPGPPPPARGTPGTRDVAGRRERPGPHSLGAKSSATRDASPKSDITTGNEACPACGELVDREDREFHAVCEHGFSRWADLVEYDPDE